MRTLSLVAGFVAALIVLSDEAPATKSDVAEQIECPAELDVLCSWPRVREILLLQTQVASAKSSDDRTRIIDSQIKILKNMWDITPLYMVTKYLTDEYLSMGDRGVALEITNEASAHGIERFKELESESLVGEVHDTVKLIDLQLRHGTKASARIRFDSFTQYLTKRHSGFVAVFAMAEIGVSLARSGFVYPARAYFERGQKFSYRSSAFDDGAETPRAMAFLQLAQKAADAGFSEMAFSYYDQAKSLVPRDGLGDRNWSKILISYKNYLKAVLTEEKNK